MKFLLFKGCNIPARVSQYEEASRAVLTKLDVELAEDSGFNCCGYPMQNIDQKAYVLSAAKNLALAEKNGFDILVMCKCCFGSLKKAANILKEDSDLLKDINSILKKEGLIYKGKVEIKHLLSVLYHDVGTKTIKKQVTTPFKKLNIATHYGCHALRPSKITEFDNPANPVIFDELVKVTGAKSIDWAEKLECCGAPLTGINDNVSVKQTMKKIKSGIDAGANFLCSACPYCQIQFDTIQYNIGSEKQLASIIYPQLLGLTMGIDEKTLGIDMNQLDIEGITKFIDLGVEENASK